MKLSKNEVFSTRQQIVFTLPFIVRQSMCMKVYVQP